MFPITDVHSRNKTYKTSAVSDLQLNLHCAQGNVHILLKNLHLDSLNQKMYRTYNNKDFDIYLYAIIELIYHLFMHQISLYTLYEQN